MAIDIQPPILKSLVFPQIVDISNGTAPFKITVRADGTGSLIASVSLIFDRQLVGIYNYIVHPTQAPETFSFYWLPGSWSDDNWNDGEVSQTFGVKPSNENQTLNLLKVIVADREGNERTYLPLELVGISASTQFSVVGSLIDKTAPSISISSNLKTINSSQTATVTFALSEASTNFVATDVIVTGGILTNFNGSGAIYTAIFTPTTKSTANGVIRVASGAFTDAAGNLNTDDFFANNTLTLTVDTISPTIALISGKTNLFATDAVTLTFNLSEASTTFTATDVVVTGGNISNFTGSGTSYSALFKPSTSANTATISVPNGAFTDVAGNSNADGADANNTLNFLIAPEIQYETHTLAVIVDKGVLSAGAVLLKGLNEKMTLTNGAITLHTVEYAGSTFDYKQIDALVTTVVRDGEFTDEYRKELTDAMPSTINLTYRDAVLLVGSTNIDNQLILIAGMDNSYVS